jgi:hypothetical protein
LTAADVLPDRLDLLCRLTSSTPTWTLVKGASSALNGRGDIDGAAPTDDWDRVSNACLAWAAETGRGPVLACDHIPGSLVLAVVEPATKQIVQVDVLDHRQVHGTTVLRATDFLSATLERDGYRRLSPGAEAVARVVLDEFRPGAPAIAVGSLAELRALLLDDPDGARALSNRLAPRFQASIRAVAAGTWPRASLLAAEVACLLEGLRRPLPLVARMVAAPGRRACPLLKALANERTVAGDLGDWIDAVRRIHPHPRL